MVALGNRDVVLFISLVPWSAYIIGVIMNFQLHYLFRKIQFSLCEKKSHFEMWVGKFWYNKSVWYTISIHVFLLKPDSSTNLDMKSIIVIQGGAKGGRSCLRMESTLSDPTVGSPGHFQWGWILSSAFPVPTDTCVRGFFSISLLIW